MVDLVAISATDQTRQWRDLGRIVTAHVVMLRDAGIIDDAALASLLTPIDAAARGEPSGAGLDGIIAAFDERVDALVRPGLVGATTIGRGRSDTASALARLTIRSALLNLARNAEGARRALIELAAGHAATIVPAFAGGQPVQPTTFGHFLGGTIGPLVRAHAQIAAAQQAVNRGPLGAVALASTGFPISRERTAALLGFDGLLENTFDAVAATDHLVLAANSAAAVASPLGRLLTELLAWLRDQPDSLRLGDRWVSGDPGLPQMRRPTGLERLALLARRAGLIAAEVAATACLAAYEPLGPTQDDLLHGASSAIETAAHVAKSVADLCGEDFDVNRAYLANRAGRAFITASDLAAFLMTDEKLDPAAAANVAALTISRARAEGVEISGVTPQMIDGAAMMVIGRELGVELEAISRHLAPRRFLERRTASGGPAPATVREHLAGERRRLDADTRWRSDAEDRLLTAERDLDRLVEDAAATSG